MLEGQRGGEVLLAGGPGFQHGLDGHDGGTLPQSTYTLHTTEVHRLCAGWLGR